MDNAIAQAVRAIAEGRKITLLAAAEVLKAQIRARAEQIRREQKFGPLPDQYDLAKDPDHPGYSNGLHLDEPAW